MNYYDIWVCIDLRRLKVLAHRTFNFAQIIFSHVINANSCVQRTFCTRALQSTPQEWIYESRAETHERFYKIEVHRHRFTEMRERYLSRNVKIGERFA